jgi:hypothetical protein
VIARLVALALFAVGCTSGLTPAQCAAGQDVARALCIAYHSKQNPDDGIAVVAEKFCAARTQLEPFAQAACQVAAAQSQSVKDAAAE